MTNKPLATQLLDLALDYEIAGRDMTAQRLRDIAAELIANPEPKQMRHIRAFIDQVARK